MIHEKAREWNFPVWMAAVGFINSFDTVGRLYLREALVNARLDRTFWL